MGYLTKIRQFFYSCCVAQIALVPLLSADSWEAPENLSFPSLAVETFDGSVLDVNASNNGVGVWVAQDNVYSSYYTVETGWSTQQIISSLAVIPSTTTRIFNDQSGAHVSLNQANYSVAVWDASEYIIADDTTIRGIYSATRSAAGVWSPVQRVSALNLTDPTFFPSDPRSAVNDNGLSVAVWTELRTDDTINTFRYVMASFLPQGGVWTAPVQISDPFSPFTLPFLTPDVAINNNGDVVVVWEADVTGGGQLTVFGATYSGTTSTWSLPVTLNPPANVTSIPRADIDPNGNAVAVWATYQFVGVGFVGTVYGASFTPLGGWAPSVTITTGPSRPEVPNVVIDRFGTSTAIWNETIGAVRQVYASRLPLGGSWSAPIILGDGVSDFINIGRLQRPISVDLDGNVMVIYTNFDEETDVTSLFSIKYDITLGAWQEPLFISSDQAYSTQFSPSFNNIGIGSCGFALSLWEAANGTGGTNPITQVFSSVNLGDEPLAPCNFTGSRCRTKFVTQSVVIDQFTWGKCETCVAFYNLYRNGVLIATIPADAPGAFTETTCSRAPAVYTLTAVSVNGVEGPASTVTLQ